MQGHDFIFCFQDSQFNFWQIDPTLGTVTKNGQPYFMEFAPAGWDDISISNVRNKRYWGIDRSVTIPLAYVMDGADILKEIFYTLGIEEPVYLVICSQQLYYSPPPSAILSVSTGGNPLIVSNNNNGTITGTPGETVYFNVNTAAFTVTDGIFGTVVAGTSSYNININNYNGNSTYGIVMPASGVANYYLAFFGGGAATATLSITNQIGGQDAIYKYWYKQIFRGQIDFSTFLHDGPKVTCRALDSGLSKYLKSNEGTTIEIPMDDHNAIWVKMDGIFLHETGNYAPIPAFDLPVDNTVYDAPVTFINNEGDHTGMDLTSQRFEDTSAEPDNAIITNFDQVGVVVNLKGRLSMICTERTASAANTRFFFVRTLDNAVLGPPFSYGIPGPGNTYFVWVQGESQSVDFDINIPLEPGEQIKIRFQSEFVGTSCSFQFKEDSFIKATFKTRYQTTYTRCFTGQYLMSKFVEFITDSTYTAALVNYFNINRNVLFTSGNALRQLNDATLKTNFSDFFQFWDSFDSVGIWEKKNQVYFDRKKGMVDYNNVIWLPPPKEGTFKISFNKDFYFNELSIGYPELKNEIGIVNGNQEYNDTMLWSLGTSISPARIDKTTKYRTSPYEMEKMRITVIKKDTTDYKNDNEVFVLWVEDNLQPETIVSVDPLIIAQYHNLDRSLNAGTLGLIEPDTVFNLRLTPKRNMLRNGDWFRSSLYMSDGRTFTFKTADRNSSVVCDGLAESGPENVGTMGDKFFLPVDINAEFDSEETVLDLLDANPLQVFAFPMPGFDVYGIMQTSGVSPSNKKSQQYSFLSAPFNDMQKMKEYNG